MNVTFKGNPAAEVSWTFNPWNSNTSHDVPFHKIQNKSKYHTALVIETLNTNDFGTYKLQLKNIHGSISKDFIIEGTFLFSIFCFILPMGNLSFCVLTFCFEFISLNDYIFKRFGIFLGRCDLVL